MAVLHLELINHRVNILMLEYQNHSFQCTGAAGFMLTSWVLVNSQSPFDSELF